MQTFYIHSIDLYEHLQLIIFDKGEEWESLDSAVIDLFNNVLFWFPSADQMFHHVTAEAQTCTVPPPQIVIT